MFIVQTLCLDVDDCVPNVAQSNDLVLASKFVHNHTHTQPHIYTTIISFVHISFFLMCQTNTIPSQPFFFKLNEMNFKKNAKQSLNQMSIKMRWSFLCFLILMFLFCFCRWFHFQKTFASLYIMRVRACIYVCARTTLIRACSLTTRTQKESTIIKYTLYSFLW